VLPTPLREGRCGSTLCCYSGNPQPFDVLDDLTEQGPDRLRILGDYLQLIAESTRRRVKRDGILRASTPKQTLFGARDGSELGLKVGAKICQAQLQARDIVIGLPRTVMHIPFDS
jgi:hypothetical protein